MKQLIAQIVVATPQTEHSAQHGESARARRIFRQPFADKRPEGLVNFSFNGSDSQPVAQMEDSHQIGLRRTSTVRKGNAAFEKPIDEFRVREFGASVERRSYDGWNVSRLVPARC